MTCQDYQNLLSAYLDRELKPDDQKEVSHHLEMCARCQGEVRQLLSVKETLRAQKLPSIPADLIADIEAQTLYQPGRWSSLNRWAGPVLALATAAAAWAFFEFHRPQVPGVPLTIQVTQAPKESMKLAQAVLASQPVSDSDTDKEDLQ